MMSPAMLSVALLPVLVALASAVVGGSAAAEGGQLLGSVARFQADLGPVSDQAVLKSAIDSAKRTLDALLALAQQRGLRASAGARGERDPVQLGYPDSSYLNSALATSEAEYKDDKKQRDETEENWKLKDHRLLKEVYLVPTYPCALERRIGEWGDGGKWLCLKHRKVNAKPVALSIGCHGETSFERSFSELLHGFSHTIDFSLSKELQAEMSALPYMKFYSLGLSGAEQLKTLPANFPREQFRTLPQLLEVTGKDYFDVFKIDCEGCELGVVDDMVSQFSRDKPRFGQIQMEIHYINGQYKGILQLIRNLEGLGYRLFHVEQNPIWANGVEACFIHELLVKPVT